MLILIQRHCFRIIVGGLFAASGGLFADEPFAGCPFACGLFADGSFADGPFAGGSFATHS